MLDCDECALLRLRVGAAHLVVGRKDQSARIAVYDRELAGARGLKDARDARDRGDLERAREDRTVRRRPAVLRDDRRDLLHVERREVRGQQGRSHHDRAFGELLIVMTHSQQSRGDALADVLDVDAALAEVGVVESAEHARVLREHALQRFERVPGAGELGFQLLHEAFVFEDLDVRMKDGREVRAETQRHVFAQILELAARLLERVLEIALFLDPVLVRGVLDLLEVDRVAEKVKRPDRDAARSRDALQHRVALGAARGCRQGRRASELFDQARAPLLAAGDHREQLRVHHHRRDQLRTRLEQLHLRIAEASRLARLHHEHADREAFAGQAAHFERRGGERRELLLARFREVAIGGVLLRVGKRLRFAARRHVPDEALADRELHLADGALVEPHRGRERERCAIGAGQVDGADIGIEPLRDEVGDVVERLFEIVRTRDDAGDIGDQGSALCTAVGNHWASRVFARW